MRILVSLFILWGIVLSVGCQAIPAEPLSTSVPVSPTRGEPQMTPSPSTPVDPSLQNLIEKAKADLAQRLSISVDEILLVEATNVVWPDASLGCPQEGMAYAQVLTPGYLIRLQSGNQEFAYHASRGTTVIYCENPAPPIPGTPADT